jgi:hypothetical protein
VYATSSEACYSVTTDSSSKKIERRHETVQILLKVALNAKCQVLVKDKEFLLLIGHRITHKLAAM